MEKFPYEIKVVKITSLKNNTWISLHRCAEDSTDVRGRYETLYANSSLNFLKHRNYAISCNLKLRNKLVEFYHIIIWPETPGILNGRKLYKQLTITGLMCHKKHLQFDITKCLMKHHRDSAGITTKYLIRK